MNISIYNFNVARLGYYEFNKSYPPNTKDRLNATLYHLSKISKHYNIITLQEVPLIYLSHFCETLDNYDCKFNEKILEMKNASISVTFVHNSLTVKPHKKIIDNKFYGRYVCIEVDRKGKPPLLLLNVHIPFDSKYSEGPKKPWRKKHFWKNLLKFLELNKGKDILICGDFNTYLPHDATNNVSSSPLAEYLNILKINYGYSDITSSNKCFTYFYKSDKTKACKLDYCFVSKSLAKQPFNFDYDHSVRISKKHNQFTLSDHSAMKIII